MTKAQTDTENRVIDVTDSSPEAAVRNYLVLLHEPQRLTDEEAIHKAERALEEATDHLERLLARQQLRDLQVPDVEALTSGFKKHAKDWADKTGVTADTFMAEGVSAEVLKEAGFDVQLRAIDRSQRTTGRRRQTRVNRKTIRANIPTTKDPFTANDIINKTGASSNPVRETIYAMVEEGLVEDLGPDPDHQGPGRASTLYRRVR